MRYLLIASILLMSFLSACKPEGPDGDPDYGTARDNSQAVAAFDDVFTVGEQAMADAGVNKTSDLCAALSLDTAARRLTIDFGSGCTGPDGRTRAGIIRVDYEGRRFTPSFEATYTFISYTVEGVQVEGSLIVDGFARNAAGKLTFSYQIVGGKLTFEDETSASYNGDRTWTLAEGEGSFDPAAIVYEVTGSGTGVTRSGLAYTETILTPLAVKVACLLGGEVFPVSGVQQIVAAATGEVLSIDYGDGACDKKGVLTWRGQDYSFNLE